MQGKLMSMNKGGLDMLNITNENDIIGLDYVSFPTLGLKVIAEGIEQQSQYQLLKALDCDYGQGYFISKPLNAK